MKTRVILVGIGYGFLILEVGHRINGIAEGHHVQGRRRLPSTLDVSSPTVSLYIRMCVPTPGGPHDPNQVTYACRTLLQLVVRQSLKDDLM